MDLNNKIKKLAEKFFDEIISIRREIHSKPELSFEEFETSAFVQSKLKEWGISFKSGIVKTGILAEVQGHSSGRTIAFRADMDALPIHELNDIPYKSIYEGKMHACGHDVHTASLLGAVKILSELKDEFRGKIYFVFQPGEERIPGGANLMLQENIFGNEPPELIIAQHVYPDMEAGKIGFREGMYMASSDEIYITVKGKGGHAALPHKLVDPVLITSHLIVALQQIISRNNPAGIPGVLSFGMIEAKGAVNVIPDEVKVEGTFRTMNEEWRSRAHSLIEKIVYNSCKAMGGEAELEIRHGYPVLFNDISVTRDAKKIAAGYLGEDNIEELDIRMTAEDFAYFSQKYPSMLFRLGVAPKNEPPKSLHSATFNVDEKSLKIAMGVMAAMAVKFLE